MAKSFESTALRALARSESLRATVPAPVAALLGIGPGDVIVWTVEPGTATITVSKKGEASGAVKESKRR
jgi:bifunctional DNA-binding transcriptional regulator/antitoxin component of YhaV-PrlF toxin-antitoxin module